jgi:hypothetical protein
MRWLIAVVVVALLGGGAFWYFSSDNGTPSSPIDQNYRGSLDGSMPSQYRDYDPYAPLTEQARAKVNSPVFGCAANDGKPRATNVEVDKLTPCWNQVLHVIVDDQMNPHFSKYTNVIGGHSVHLAKDLNSYNRYEKTGEDHYKFTVVPKNEAMYDFDVIHLGANLNDGTRFKGMETYYRINNGVWELQTRNTFEGLGFNTGDPIVGERNTLEVVVVIYDTQAPNASVSVPFDWSKMAKGTGLPHFPKIG